jgi:Fic/DOC family
MGRDLGAGEAGGVGGGMSDTLARFLTESLHIEGIMRSPTDEEIQASERFLRLMDVSALALGDLQAVYAPGHPLREKVGMDVQVGNYVAPPGGPSIVKRLQALCRYVNRLDARDPWQTHCKFESLHPYMDGNGRTGRILWVWHMRKVGRDPFALSFLHRWYYQTLEHSR